MLSELLQDLRFAGRVMLRKPGLTALAVFLLTLGLGASLTVFAAVNGVLLQPLAYEAPEELVRVGNSVSLPDVFDWREQAKTFAEIGAWSGWEYDFMADGRPRRLKAVAISASALRALRAEPIHGRLFLDEEDQAQAEHLVLVGEGFWRRSFGADPDLVGRQLELSGNSYRVLGVLPAALRPPDNEQVDLWTPLSVEAPWATVDRGTRIFQAVARLAPGIGLTRAQADMQTVASRLEQAHPNSNQDIDVSLMELKETLVGEARPALLAQLFAVGFVLLIACANVANLLLARGAARRGELAVRASLGVGRWRLVRQLLAESLLLTGLSGALGLALAVGATRWLARASAQSGIPRAEEIAIDGRVLAFAALAWLACATVLCLVSSSQALGLRVNQTLRGGGRAGWSRAQRRLHHALIISEVLVALLLLVGAGLAIRSFYRLTSIEPGFEPERLLTMEISLPSSRYYPIESQTPVFRQILERASALPGVVSAGAISHLPLAEAGAHLGLFAEGQPLPPPGQELKVYSRTVSARYFETLGIPLLAGRHLTEADREGAPLVALINRPLEQLLWPGEDAVGKRFRWIYGPEEEPLIEVVGVVGDVRHDGLKTEDTPAIYNPYPQKLRDWKRSMTLALRTQSAPLAAVESARQAIWDVDPLLPVTDVRSMADRMASGVAPERFTMLLLTAFAAVALILAIAGLYALVAYTVTQRTHEIGVRMALGAQRSEVLRGVFSTSIRLVLVAMTLGLAAAYLLSPLLSSLLFEIEATDALTFAAVSLLLLVTAALASYLPARRAAAVDPMHSLRHE